MLIQLLLVLFVKIVLGDSTVRINNANGFIDFSKNVNNGTIYSGTTVYLDSDLSLSDKTFEPIGNDSVNHFLGVFDGQGHIISDLKMSSSSYYTGLFGYSTGVTIRNVVLDSSCSITKSYGGSNVYTGGVIGYCYANSGHCNIENSVNMADATFSGNSNSLNLGGIAGRLWSSPSYPIYVKNCANYGSVIQSGISRWSYIGGIVGYLYGSGSFYVHLYNCINYGTITNNGLSSSELHLGGIAGHNERAYIENCVSAGKISSKKSRYIGSIIGYAYRDTYIKYCYYTDELNKYEMYGRGTPKASSYALSYDSSTFKLNGTVSVGSYTVNSLINALNAYSDYYFLRDYSKWLLNKEEKSVNFTINSRTSPITMNYRIILTPSLVSEENISFDGWYNDNKYSHPLELFEVTEDKTLYGKFEENTKKYTITFDTKGGSSVASITAQFGSVVQLPSDSIREHCNIVFWETEYGDYVGLSLAMPARNLTLYAVWKCTHITSPNDFIDFSKTVNSGTDDFSGTIYSGTTVYLDSDLSLFGKIFEPIGKDDVNCFCGVFDGQGHIISDLKMNSFSERTGLFGHSNGLTIRNVVLDSSCSITSSYIGSFYADVGGIIGYCSTSNGECNIENSVNMANVAFSGSISSSLLIGGVAGSISSSSSSSSSLKYPVYVKNCANYGSVTLSETSENSYVGGIVGYLYGLSQSYTYVYNCLNYGTITHSGTTGSLYIGGISGYISSVCIENCVSAGKISTQNALSTSYIGGIVGYVYSGTNITHCYYTNDVGVNSPYGMSKPKSEIETPHSPSTVNSTLIINLNIYATEKTWNKWLLNVNNASVSFIINYEKSLTANSQIVLLPDLANNSERNFSGWYTDANLDTLFNLSQVDSNTTLYGMFCEPSKYTVTLDANGGNELDENEMIVGCMSYYGPFPENVTRTGHTFLGWFTEREGGGYKVESGDKVKTLNNHTLYAHWVINNYTVTFDFYNGTIVNKIFAYNTSVEYPKDEDMKREGYTFNGWNETVVNMPAQNTTITALWRTNNYTVTFDVNGGDELSETSMTVTFDSPYESLPTSSKEGHMFLGWLTDNNASITNETIVIIADNHTLHAHWEKVTTQVEIVFNTKDLSREDIEEIVKKYTDAKFEITEFEESGEIRAIVKFIDNEEASNFVENIRESSEMNDIKKVSFVLGEASSISPMLCPIIFFNIIFFII